MDDKNWVAVYSAQGRLSAEMVRILLESFAIPAILSQESVGATYGFTIGDLGEVDILVQASKADEAAEILRAMDEGNLEADNVVSENKDDGETNPTKD